MEKYLDCVVGEFKKFSPEGDMERFPGNTFLCHLPKNDIWYFARYAQTQTDITSFAYKFALLPPSSFHMTVYEGVCERVRNPNNWVEGMSTEASMKEVADYFISQMDKIPRAKTIKMKIKQCVLKDSVRFLLTPYDEDTKKYLQEFRSFMQEQVKMKNMNASEYHFHISLSYLLIALTPEEQEEFSKILESINNIIKEKDFVIEFDPIEFCSFNDMGHFETLSQLEKLS